MPLQLLSIDICDFTTCIKMLNPIYKSYSNLTIIDISPNVLREDFEKFKADLPDKKSIYFTK